MNFEGILDGIIDTSRKSIAMEDGDYLVDGLLYCGKCHTKKQTTVEFMGKVRHPMCLCECAVKKREEEEKQRKHAELMMQIERYRKMGFPETEMAKWNFDNDDMANKTVTGVMKNYVDNFRRFYRDGKGLLIYGNVGTGKTYAACEVANALIDKGYPVMVTNFARLTNTLQGMYAGKQEYIDSLNEFDLLVIDDLGAERQSDFMQEMVYTIIDARYRSGLPFIVTTNLEMEEIKNPEKIGNARIYDRVLERCFPVEVKGGSRRRKAVREDYDELKNLLGL